MATCAYCGTQIPDTVKFCPECGAEQPPTQTANQTAYQQPTYGQPAQQSYGQQQTYQQPYGQQPVYSTPAQPVNDSGSIGWGILGFLIPIVGLVLFLVWKDTKPKSAKVAGIGALVSVVLSIIFYVIGGVGLIATSAMS